MSTSVNVGTDESARLLSSSPKQSSTVATPAGETGLPNRVRRTQLSVVIIAACLLGIIAWVALGVLLPTIVDGRAYSVRRSLLDVLVVDSVHLVLVFATMTFLRSMQKALLPYAFHSAVIQLLLLFGKIWAYNGWYAPTSDDITVTLDNDSSDMASLFWLSPAVFVVCIVVSVVHIVCFMFIDRIDNPPKKKIRVKGFIKILRPYFAPQGIGNKLIVAVTIIIVLASRFSNLVAPLMMGNAVQQLSQSPASTPYVPIILFGVFSLLPTILQELQEVLSARVWRVAFAEVAEGTFRHVHSLSLEWHLKKRMGNVVRAMDRGLNAAESLVGWVLLYLGPAVISAVATFLLFVIHFDQPAVAGVTAFFLSLYCWLTYVLTMWKRKFNEEMNTHDNEMHEKATDALINFETVKYFTNEEYEATNYVKSVKQYQSFSYTATATGALLNFSQQTVIQTCTVLALIISANLCVAANPNKVNPGIFVAVNLYLIQLFEPLSYLGSIYQWIIQSAVNMQNLSDLLQEKADIVDRPGATALSLPTSEKLANGLSIEYRNVFFKYPAQAEGQGLKAVSFMIPPGTITAVVGHTGSCKTTLSRLLFRFYDLDRGEILVGGQNISDVTQQTLRRAIGMVPQDTVMFNESIRHNIAYGRLDASQEDVERAARQAQIYDFIQTLPEKWDTVVGERGLKLSGGEKQRVAIARCLLKNPPIVVLDEATSALDNKTELEVQNALKCLAGRTTLIIAHRLTTVQKADQILVMKEGRVVQRGTHDELLAEADGAYAQMWFAQQRQEEAQLQAALEKEKSESVHGSAVGGAAPAAAAVSSIGEPVTPHKFVHPLLEDEEDD